MPNNEKDWTVLRMLEWATEYFRKRDVPNPRLSIEWLLADTLDVKRLDLYLKYDRPLTKGELDELRNKVKRRSRHEPLQYITGHTDFYGCRIEVNRSVLIPRAETEQLVELILNDQGKRKEQPLEILDIGTGSGCIPIALAHSAPNWSCTGIDKSTEALELAKKNALVNETDIRFVRENILHLNNKNKLTGLSFDLIVSNPPYILEDEKKTMEKQVLDYEPRDALFHENPIQIYDLIAEYAMRNLNAPGFLYLECNDRLTEQISLTLKNRFESVDILKDYDKNNRFIRATKNT
jgi:release factor glutamine methyltransferase